MNCFSSGGRKNPAVPMPRYDLLARTSAFSKADLKQIFSKFLDTADETGLVTRAIFLSLPEVAFNPLASMVFDKEIAKSKAGALNFEEFVQLMNMFSATVNPGLKLRYLFDLVKQPSAPNLTQEDFHLLLCALAGGAHIAQPLLAELSRRSWASAISTVASDQGGRSASNPGTAPTSTSEAGMDFHQFRGLVSVFDLHSLMTIDF
ncbi:hypothetical protein B484DRAFT_452644 [Ochromonadaceae sp. CCMP2298]|nr:hypothetical protein B484DRAFT_452644 [Ochromonadaceae sp. CCMP2298]|mmetsp:Transcript_28057/g.62804  ORF Transcript_28057/g.62804 Transcript_28057/m.62804 type:complete len:205 (+) Transcript_28057:85-699(+)